MQEVAACVNGPPERPAVAKEHFIIVMISSLPFTLIYSIIPNLNHCPTPKLLPTLQWVASVLGIDGILQIFWINFSFFKILFL